MTDFLITTPEIACAMLADKIGAEVVDTIKQNSDMEVAVVENSDKVVHLPLPFYAATNNLASAAPVEDEDMGAMSAAGAHTYYGDIYELAVKTGIRDLLEQEYAGTDLHIRRNHHGQIIVRKEGVHDWELGFSKNYGQHLMDN